MKSELTQTGKRSAPAFSTGHFNEFPLDVGIDLSRAAAARMTPDIEAILERKLLPAIPGYQLISEIGSGPGTKIYKAMQIDDGKTVAVKTIDLCPIADTAFSRRFTLSAQKAISLKHCGIVRCHSAGRAGKCHYVAMELVDGISMEKIIAKRGRLGERLALSVLIAAVDALGDADISGITHGNIKPSNILFTRQHAVKLTDFALAHRTGLLQAEPDPAEDTTTLNEGLTMIGTPAYLSPERVRGDRELDARSDICSLGMTAFHMLTGAPPFTGSVAEVLAARLCKPVPLVRMLTPDVSPLTNVIIRRMTAREPESRYQTYNELLDDLRKAYAGLRADPNKERRESQEQQERSSAKHQIPDKRADGKRQEARRCSRTEPETQACLYEDAEISPVPARERGAFRVWFNRNAVIPPAARGEEGAAFSNPITLIARRNDSGKFSAPIRDGEEFTIGRDRGSCQIVIEDAGTSSCHCTVRRAGDTIFVQDCGSLNGTTVDGQRLAPWTMVEAVRRIGVGKIGFEISHNPGAASAAHGNQQRHIAVK
ncbi:MAG TPA: FHA domain-containing serine/threonine-protein kinase [Candidatus Brocadiia bacterium]|nr:FHA domain-containing serine/threonine-protein kinase [Candidatus Brocadiia bacterium]